MLGPHVLHVHACDAVRDVRAGQATVVELGRGTADLPELLGRLTEFDYRGWVTIECGASANPLSEIENAVSFLRAVNGGHQYNRCGRCNRILRLDKRPFVSYENVRESAFAVRQIFSSTCARCYGHTSGRRLRNGPIERSRHAIRRCGCVDRVSK